MDVKTSLGILLSFLLVFTAAILRSLVPTDSGGLWMLRAVSWGCNLGSLVLLAVALRSSIATPFKVVYGAIGFASLLTFVWSLIWMS